MNLHPRRESGVVRTLDTLAQESAEMEGVEKNALNPGDRLVTTRVVWCIRCWGRSLLRHRGWFNRMVSHPFSASALHLRGQALHQARGRRTASVRTPWSPGSGGSINREGVGTDPTGRRLFVSRFCSALVPALRQPSPRTTLDRIHLLGFPDRDLRRCRGRGP
jgi:hypothetical protein